MLDAFKKHQYGWRVVSWRRVMADSNAAKIANALNARLTDIVPSSPCNTFYTASAPDPAIGYEVFKVKSSSLRRNLAEPFQAPCTARTYSNADGAGAGRFGRLF